MGVPKLYKLFVSVMEGILTNEIQEPFGFLGDLNGFLHKCAGAVFGYGNNLQGVEISPDLKAHIRQKLKSSQGKEQLKLEFLNSIGPALEIIILNLIKPTDVLCLAIDGKAPFAKGVQQRLRRNKSGFERHEYNPLNENIHPSEKFDTAYLTAGLPFMREASQAVKNWINANKDRLPHYTLFSGSDTPGEGEHKIFKMLEEVRKYILENDQTITNKDKDITFRSQKIIVYGLDADLGVLSMMRDYNFIWLREQYNIRKLEPGVNIDIARSNVVAAMKPESIEDSQITKENKKALINDFALMSFFIGDDFVPAMFTLTANIKNSLDRFMQKYALLSKNGFKYLVNEYGDFIIDNFTDFVNELVEVEEELYKFRAEIDLAERTLQENPGNQEDIDKVVELRKINGIKINNYETYTPAPILSYQYEQFLEYWKQILCRPCLLSNRLPQSHRINYLLNVDQNLIDEENDAICQDYLTGLQWNIKYYMGYEVNNWYYKKPYPPTINALSKFLKSGKYVHQNVIRLPTDPVISVTQMLVMTINPHYSPEVIKSFFKSDKAYNAAIVNCGYINTIFPKTISFSFQGKYKSEEHSKIPILPPIIFDDILKIIPSTRNEIIDNFPYDWILGGSETTFPRILKSTIGIGRDNDIKVFRKEDVIKKSRASSPLGGNRPSSPTRLIKNDEKHHSVFKKDTPDEDEDDNVKENKKEETTVKNQKHQDRGGNDGRGRGRGRGREGNDGRGRGRGRGRGGNDSITINPNDKMKVGKFRIIGIGSKKDDNNEYV